MGVWEAGMASKTDLLTFSRLLMHNSPRIDIILLSYGRCF